MGGSYHASSDESFPLLVPHQPDLRLQLLLDVAIQVLLQVLWEAERKTLRKEERTNRQRLIYFYGAYFCVPGVCL